MYYIIYGLLYSISLLPFFVLYRISDVFSFLLYHVFGYRKAIVMHNLNIAFPEKSDSEKKAIAKQFYKNLVDTFVESIKMISMSLGAFDKRCTMDCEAPNTLAAAGKNIQFLSGHQMNWEYANWVGARNMNIPWVGVYQPIANKIMHKIFYNMRVKSGSVLVSTKEFKNMRETIFKSQYSLVLAADQNPGSFNGYWMYFFTRPVPFISGPDKGALKNNTAVIFVNSVKTKRGYYHYETKVIAESTENYKPGELTIMYRDFLEEIVRQQPANYLWTHRRWRYNFGADVDHLWMDTKPKP